MTLAAGARLGPYEIVAPLGAGGMGEVYRARDAKLDRDVAIKLLPDVFAQDPDRLARFEREAKTLAALNHPNIASIYGLEESAPSTGSGQAGARALVLELVEGPTLADRIAQGPIPLDEALPIARQIAEALEAAHEKGVTHRDLKPANIKLRPDGVVKVLDFGLAKLAETGGASGSPAAAGLSQSPTITSPAATGIGVILGTAGYMAPEQARGKVVDRRADIWAYGCVLYEMLSGARTFGGDDVTDTIAAVVRAEPDWRKLPSDTPTSILRLLRRCMQKDVHERLPDIGTARLEIKEATIEIEAPLRATVRPGPLTRERVVSGALALVLSLIAGTFAILYFRAPAQATAPEMRVEINTPPTQDPVSFAISPDGQRLVFVASGDGGQPQMWLRPLNAVSAQPLAGTEGATYPFWSPDSRSVAFFAAGALKRIDISGGPPQTLANVPTGRGGAWSANGTILFARLSTPLLRIPAGGGDAVAVTKLDPPRQTAHGLPQFLPGDRQFLYYVVGTEETQGIWLGSLDAPEARRLTAADTAGAYVAPGWLLFVRQGTLVAKRFDVEKSELIGDPITVADAIASELGRGAFSTSATGLIGYRAGAASRRQLTWVDRSGKTVGTIGAPDQNELTTVELSPDGLRVAVHRRVQNNTDIWLIDAARTTRFTFDPSVDQFPIWSHDGTRIVFDSNRTGQRNLYQKLASGAGTEELLLESTETKFAFDWSPDNRFLLYGNGGGDLWRLPLEGERKPFVFLKTSFQKRAGQFSPDGRWVAYQSNESGQMDIFVRPFPGPGGQWLISTAGGISPRWRPDGKELYYIAPDSTLMAAPIMVNGTTLDPGSPVALFRAPILGGGTEPYNRQQYDVAPDGRFLLNLVANEAVASPITLLLNWNPRTAN